MNVGLVSKAFLAGQFKLGIYKARQITRIERGGLVISTSDSRYQAGNGIRYELSPDEWFMYSYEFFPRDHVLEAYNDDFLAREVYYDFFAETGLGKARSGDSFKSIYAIFKNGQDTGYRVIEISTSVSRGSYREGTGRFNFGLHISDRGICEYQSADSRGFIKPFREAMGVVQAATYMLADAEDFTKTKIDLSKLAQDCENSPGSCVLHTKLTRLLKDCKNKHSYSHD